MYHAGVKKARCFSLSLQEKIEIKNRGRPTPVLAIEQHAILRGKSYIRKFSVDIYKTC